MKVLVNKRSLKFIIMLHTSLFIEHDIEDCHGIEPGRCFVIALIIEPTRARLDGIMIAYEHYILPSISILYRRPDPLTRVECLAVHVIACLLHRKETASFLCCILHRLRESQSFRSLFVIHSSSSSFVGNFFLECRNDLIYVFRYCAYYIVLHICYLF